MLSRRRSPAASSSCPAAVLRQCSAGPQGSGAARPHLAAATAPSACCHCRSRTDGAFTRRVRATGALETGHRWPLVMALYPRRAPPSGLAGSGAPTWPLSGRPEWDRPAAARAEGRRRRQRAKGSEGLEAHVRGRAPSLACMLRAWLKVAGTGKARGSSADSCPAASICP